MVASDRPPPSSAWTKTVYERATKPPYTSASSKPPNTFTRTTDSSSGREGPRPWVPSLRCGIQDTVPFSLEGFTNIWSCVLRNSRVLFLCMTAASNKASGQDAVYQENSTTGGGSQRRHVTDGYKLSIRTGERQLHFYFLMLSVKESVKCSKRLSENSWDGRVFDLNGIKIIKYTYKT